MKGPKYNQNDFDRILFAYDVEYENFIIPDKSNLGRAIGKKIENLLYEYYMFLKVIDHDRVRVYNWQYIFNFIDVKDFLEKQEQSKIGLKNLQKSKMDEEIEARRLRKKGVESLSTTVDDDD